MDNCNIENGQNDFKKFEVGDNILLVNEEWGLEAVIFQIIWQFRSVACSGSYADARVRVHVYQHNSVFLCFVIKFNSVYNMTILDTLLQKIYIFVFRNSISITAITDYSETASTPFLLKINKTTVLTRLNQWNQIFKSFHTLYLAALNCN